LIKIFIAYKIIFFSVGQVDHFEKRLCANLAELDEIRNVWKSLENVCNRLEELKDIQWITIQPKKLKVNLEELLTLMTAMVPSVKNYHSYNAVKTNIENYLKVFYLNQIFSFFLFIYLKFTIDDSFY